MKKTLLLFVFLALAAGPVFSASLIVAQPNGGEELTLGTTYQIKWTASDTTRRSGWF